MLAQVFSYVFLFIIKRRFPSHTSFAEMVRHRYNEKVLSKVRKLEKLDFKLSKCKLGIEFLEACLKNGLMPKFLNFKVANSTLRNSKSYKDCHLKLLWQEFSNKKSECQSENNKLKILRNEIVSMLTVADFTHLMTVYTNNIDNKYFVESNKRTKRCYITYDLLNAIKNVMTQVK